MNSQSLPPRRKYKYLNFEYFEHLELVQVQGVSAALMHQIIPKGADLKSYYYRVVLDFSFCYYI
jgi:hypothetical protein